MDYFYIVVLLFLPNYRMRMLSKKCFKIFRSKVLEFSNNSMSRRTDSEQVNPGSP